MIGTWMIFLQKNPHCCEGNGLNSQVVAENTCCAPGFCEVACYLREWFIQMQVRSYGGFLKRGYPKWMVYNGKSC